MQPTRSMTGDTLAEKYATSPTSPVSPTGTEHTVIGDAIIEVPEETEHRSVHNPPDSCTLSDGIPTQPCTAWKEASFPRRVAGKFQSKPDPACVTETNIRKLENTPNGFPRLSAFQSSEPNFSIYRSFSYLHSRVLLDLQDEITCLEKELDELDWDDFDEDPDRLRSREYDVGKAAQEGDARTRRVILKEIRSRLIEYDEVLIKARTVQSFQKPSDRDYRSVRRYHSNTKPLMDAEMDSIRSKEDAISLHYGREWAGFDGAVESAIDVIDRGFVKVFKMKTPPLQRIFRTQELREKTTDKFIALYSSTRIARLVNLLITMVIFVLLVVPVTIMYSLTSTVSHEASATDVASNPTLSPSSGPATDFDSRDTLNAVGVMIVFTLVFSAAMSLLTRAARHELFAASAAYCAILVVFIGNFTGPGS